MCVQTNAQKRQSVGDGYTIMSHRSLFKLHKQRSKTNMNMWRLLLQLQQEVISKLDSRTLRPVNVLHAPVSF